MLQETGRVFVEMIKVPDEPSGCGCLGWFLGIGVLIAIFLFILQFWLPILLIIIGIIILYKVLTHYL
ncbi:preprotein translocase, SecE subunit domain protein [Enterococcus sp. HY326]|uniref:preprotein translocase, SecE subunit domain protein n=1 Tax=Enterococcus sp. HY326 TaxID=2971265 RepID=UPI00223EFF04|nr:preprotein translocase, SecE subunit domain protein [Enterococcus sp. HY326]